MVVWFRHGSCTVGVEDGVVRAGDFAALTDLLDAAKTLQTERDRLLAGVGEEIDAMRAEARQQVEADTTAARTAREEAWAAGHAEGLEAAAARWTEQALREAASAQRSLIRQTQRLSQIVSLALERIIEHEDRVTLFNRSLAAITKLVRDVPMATLRVSPAELDSALTAVTAFAPCAAGRLQIEVKADSALPPGSCLFESDEGLIDAGLKTQLAAIRRAMERAAAHLLLDDTERAAEVVGLETSTAGAPAQNDEQAAPAASHEAA